MRARLFCARGIFWKGGLGAHVWDRHCERSAVKTMRQGCRHMASTTHLSACNVQCIAQVAPCWIALPLLMQFGRWRAEVLDTNATGLRLMLPEDAECALGVGEGIRCVVGPARTLDRAWTKAMSSQPALPALQTHRAALVYLSAGKVCLPRPACCCLLLHTPSTCTLASIAAPGCQHDPRLSTSICPTYRCG